MTGFIHAEWGRLAIEWLPGDVPETQSGGVHLGLLEISDLNRNFRFDTSEQGRHSPPPRCGARKHNRGAGMPECESRTLSRSSSGS